MAHIKYRYLPKIMHKPLENLYKLILRRLPKNNANNKVAMSIYQKVTKMWQLCKALKTCYRDSKIRGLASTL